jgi:soluble lytic murein transglycosylase-like protein
MKILFILLILLIPAMSKEAIFSYKWATPEITALVEREARKHNINSRIVYNLIEAESSGKVKARHPLIKIRVKGKLIITRAVGLMGIVREYHFSGTKAQLEKPVHNISTGVKVLANCIKKSKGNIVKGLMRYNGQVNNIDYSYIYKIINKRG